MDKKSNLPPTRPPVHPPLNKPVNSKPLAKLSLKRTNAPLISLAKKLSPEVDEKKLLGKGAYGKVYGTQYHDTVIKIITNTEKGVLNTSAIREVAFLRILEGKKHILQAGKFRMLEEASRITMDMYPSDLHKELLKSRTLENSCKLMVNILEGMDNIHSSGIIHADLKPANILFRSEDDIAIADFGLSVLTNPFANVENNSNIQTLDFRAPEILVAGMNNVTRCNNILTAAGKNPSNEVREAAWEAKNADVVYDGKIDMWSVGIIFLMIMGKTNNTEYRFSKGESEEMQIYRQMMANYRPERNYSHITEKDFNDNKEMMVEYKKLLHKLLHLDRVKRYTAREALNSPFIKMINNNKHYGDVGVEKMWKELRENNLPLSDTVSLSEQTKLLKERYNKIFEGKVPAGSSLPEGSLTVNSYPVTYEQIMENHLVNFIVCNHPSNDMSKILSTAKKIAHAMFADREAFTIDKEELEMCDIFRGNFFYPVVGMYIMNAYKDYILSTEMATVLLKISAKIECYDYDPFHLFNAMVDVYNGNKQLDGGKEYNRCYVFVEKMLNIN